MSAAIPRRYIIVVPPSTTAGIGNALRRAFRPEPSASMFDTLLAALDKPV